MRALNPFGPVSNEEMNCLFFFLFFADFALTEKKIYWLRLEKDSRGGIKEH
jgi:hypothetical protein